MKYSICIDTLFTELPFLERIDKVKEVGFSAFEFWEWKKRDRDIKKTGQKSKMNNLEIATFNGNIENGLVNPVQREEYLEEIKESIKVAVQLGCKSLMVLTDKLEEDGKVKETYPYLKEEKKYKSVVEGLRESAAIAEENNITLLLEPLNTLVDHPGYYLNSSKIGFKIIEEVGSENVKLLYDVYHMQIMEGNLINTLSKNIDKIGYIHIADVPGRHEPGTGEINFKKIWETLNYIGYKGFVGFELFPSKSSYEAIQSIKSVFK